MTYDITGNDIEILPYQFREISGAFAPLATRSYTTTAPRAIAASAVNPVRISALPAPAPRPIYRAPVPQAPPVNPIRIADVPHFPPVMHTDSFNQAPPGWNAGAPRAASIVSDYQRQSATIRRGAAQAVADYQRYAASQAGKSKDAFGARGGGSFIASNAPSPQTPQPANPTTSADVPPSGDAFQGQGDLPPPPAPMQVGPMTDGASQPVYQDPGYQQYQQSPYGGGWDAGYPQPQGQYQPQPQYQPQGYGGGGGGGGGNPYADQAEPPWGYPPEAQYAGPSYGPDYGDSYGSDYPAYGGTEPPYQDDNYAPPSDGTDWGSDFVDDTMADAYTADSDLGYQDLDSQYGGGLGNG